MTTQQRLAKIAAELAEMKRIEAECQKLLAAVLR